MVWDTKPANPIRGMPRAPANTLRLLLRGPFVHSQNPWSTRCGRLQRALEAIEEQLTWCRLGWYARKPSDAARYDAERLRLESQLRELLDSEEESA